MKGLCIPGISPGAPLFSRWTTKKSQFQSSTKGQLTGGETRLFTEKQRESNQVSSLQLKTRNFYQLLFHLGKVPWQGPQPQTDEIPHQVQEVLPQSKEAILETPYNIAFD